MPTPQPHSLGPLEGRTGTVLARAELLDVRLWLKTT